MSRTRARNRRNWPDYLTATKRRDGRLYYRYRHPSMDRYVGLGYDFKKAREAAAQANAQFNKGEDLLAKILGGGTTFGAYIEDTYLVEYLPKKRVKGEPLADTTLANYRQRIAKIIDALGHLVMGAGMTHAPLQAFLNEQSSAQVHLQMRTHLVDICRHAVADGKLQDNLAEKTLLRASEKKKRRPITLEHYRAIYPHAEPCIQVAMELALNITQRRGNLQTVRYDDARDDGYLYMQIQKTRKHGVSSRIRIPLDLPTIHSERGSKTIGDVIQASRDDTLSPYVVHHQPTRRKKNKDRDHWTQLSPEQLSNKFRGAREASGVFEGWPIEQQPGLHEIIGLGMELREAAGWEIRQIQKMRGHTNEKMTLQYLSYREDRWTTIEAPESK